MAVLRQKLFKADEVQACGDVYDEETLKFMASQDIRLRYEADDRTLYAYIELGEE